MSSYRVGKKACNEDRHGIDYKVMNTSILTTELINLLFPDHCRTSCSDIGLENSFNNSEGHPRCYRCLALSKVHEPLHHFKIEAKIYIRPDPEEVRKKALSKLTPYEREILGL